jgi:hypothetical protein
MNDFLDAVLSNVFYGIPSKTVLITSTQKSLLNKLSVKNVALI